MQLQQFDKKNMRSVEKEMRAKGKEIVESEDSLKLTDWIKVTLGQKAAKGEDYVQVGVSPLRGHHGGDGRCQAFHQDSGN